MITLQIFDCYPESKGLARVLLKYGHILHLLPLEVISLGGMQDWLVYIKVFMGFCREDLVRSKRQI